MSPIARLKGVVAERGLDWLIVDVNGVGYLAHGPAGTIAGARVGAEISLHTHLTVREDDMTLYGFVSAEERRLFQTLTAVSGVGPKAALALLSVMSADDLSFAIASENTAALSRAPGGGEQAGRPHSAGAAGQAGAGGPGGAARRGVGGGVRPHGAGLHAGGGDGGGGEERPACGRSYRG